MRQESKGGKEKSIKIKTNYCMHVTIPQDDYKLHELKHVLIKIFFKKETAEKMVGQRAAEKEPLRDLALNHCNTAK